VEADPQLTSIGIEQAKDIRRALEVELEHGFHLPDKVYCSPLSRALRTCEIMFDSFGHWERPQRDGARGSSLSESTLNYGSYLETSFRQNCREENGEHTCDKRNTRTYIASTYPNFTIEDGFTEEDELWTPERETERHMEERARNVLDTIFEDDCTDNTCERHSQSLIF
jgi:broad specificity phosphatase PhoE